MIDESESICEAWRPLQVMEVSIEIPHDMRYQKGAAKGCVFHLLYLGRAKRQIIRNPRRGNSYCPRPRPKRGRDDKMIPFCSTIWHAISNQRTLNTIGSPARLALFGQLKMGTSKMLPMRGALKSSLGRLSVSMSITSYILSTTV